MNNIASRTMINPNAENGKSRNNGEKFEALNAIDRAIGSQYCLNADKTKKLIAEKRDGIVNISIIDSNTDYLLVSNSFHATKEAMNEAAIFVDKEFASKGFSKIDFSVITKESLIQSFQIKSESAAIINAGKRIAFSQTFKTYDQAQSARDKISSAAADKESGGNFIHRAMKCTSGFLPYNLYGDALFDEDLNRAYMMVYSQQLKLNELPNKYREILGKEILLYIERKYPKMNDAKIEDRPMYMILSCVENEFTLTLKNIMDKVLGRCSFNQPATSRSKEKSKAADNETLKYDVDFDILQNEDGEWVLVVSFPYQIRVNSGKTVYKFSNI